MVFEEVAWRACVLWERAVKQHPFISPELTQQAELCQSAEEKTCTASTNPGDCPRGAAHLGAGVPVRGG